MEKIRFPLVSKVIYPAVIWGMYNIFHWMHSAQFHAMYSWHTMHKETGLKFDPHPLHEPLLYILLDQVTYCIKGIVCVYLLEYHYY